MTDDGDKFWEDLLTQVERAKGFMPLSVEEAERRMETAGETPLSQSSIDAIVASVMADSESATSAGRVEKAEPTGSAKPEPAAAVRRPRVAPRPRRGGRGREAGPERREKPGAPVLLFGLNRIAALLMASLLLIGVVTVAVVLLQNDGASPSPETYRTAKAVLDDPTQGVEARKQAQGRIYETVKDAVRTLQGLEENDEFKAKSDEFLKRLKRIVDGEEVARSEPVVKDESEDLGFDQAILILGEPKETGEKRTRAQGRVFSVSEEEVRDAQQLQAEEGELGTNAEQFLQELGEMLSAPRPSVGAVREPIAPPTSPITSLDPSWNHARAIEILGDLKQPLELRKKAQQRVHATAAEGIKELANGSPEDEAKQLIRALRRVLEAPAQFRRIVTHESLESVLLDDDLVKRQKLLFEHVHNAIIELSSEPGEAELAALQKARLADLLAELESTLKD